MECSIVKPYMVKRALSNPLELDAELCRRSFFHFMQVFWSEVASGTPKWNWHIPYLCSQLTQLARRVAAGLPKEFDLVVNIPPGTTKSLTCSVMFPAWVWTWAPWMRFIAASYAAPLSLELAELSRDLVRSQAFQDRFPGYSIKQDKDTKSNFRIQYPEYDDEGKLQGYRFGGNRFSTSVGGSLTGFHGHILLVDDPLDPKRAASEAELKSANSWIDQTLSTRKIDKTVTPTVLIMQRLSQKDCTGHLLEKKKGNIRHICLPGDGIEYAENIKPAHLAKYYVDGMLDPVRMPRSVLTEMKLDLGQYGYAGQVGQSPAPPSGGMFQPDNMPIVDSPTAPISGKVLRYWDKAATAEDGCFTVGVKMAKLTNGRYCILHIIKGQWDTARREQVVQSTAKLDGTGCFVYMEQEPGSAGKDSVRESIRGLDGFIALPDKPTGDKVTRADPFSVQVNAGNVEMIRGEWNTSFVDELRFFPSGKYKDQVDAASGAYNKLRKGLPVTVRPFDL